MKYLLMIYGDEAAMAASSATDQMSEGYRTYTEALKKAGALLGGDRLHPTTTATTVRSVNGKAKVMNGPYAETREQLGGYYLIEAADIDAAIEWANRCPGSQKGAIEVRPIWEFPPSM